MSGSGSTREDFDAIDTDGDGYITAGELKASLEGNPKITEENVHTIIEMADKDEDHQITYEEYAEFIR